MKNISFHNQKGVYCMGRTRFWIGKNPKYWYS